MTEFPWRNCPRQPHSHGAVRTGLSLSRTLLLTEEPGQWRIDEHLQSAEGTMGPSRVLVTFDVDGTLVTSKGPYANLLHKRAFNHAFKSVCGIDGDIDVIKHHGSTDPKVLVHTLMHYGVEEQTALQALPEMKKQMLEYALAHAADVKHGLELLPGVANLLEALHKRPEVVIGLVTGNLEEIAWLKMEGLKVRQFFTVPNFGGFGSDHSDRGELVRTAASRGLQIYPDGFRLRVHVGDTPNDVKAAEFGGAVPIGVCTGVFTREDLLASWTNNGAVPLVLNDLADPTAFFNACGLEPERDTSP